MGSEYKIAESDDKKIELTLAEMSNKFDLIANVPETRAHDGYYKVACGLTPENLVDIAFKFIQTAAYWADGKEMRELIKKKLEGVYFLD